MKNLNLRDGSFPALATTVTRALGQQRPTAPLKTDRQQEEGLQTKHSIQHLGQDGHGRGPRDICCWIRNRGGRGVRDQFAGAGCGLYLCCSAAVARRTMNDDRELAAAPDI